MSFLLLSVIFLSQAGSANDEHELPKLKSTSRAHDDRGGDPEFLESGCRRSVSLTKVKLVVTARNSEYRIAYQPSRHHSLQVLRHLYGLFWK